MVLRQWRSLFTLMFDELSGADVPLFVPILVNECRSELRSYLIRQEIYLPIHWPITDVHGDLNKRTRRLYDEELSVVCDQRYSVKDMQRIVQLIADFFRRRKDGNI